jgi:CIC family chloride channel protein
MILSVLVGFLAGLVAVIIKYLVHIIKFLLTSNFVKEYQNILFFFYPAIGILLSILLIKYFIRQRVEHGIPSVLYAISSTRGKIKRHNLFSSIVASALTVGFGGSVGLEGPTVATGAAYGSNIGRLFHLSYKELILLLGAASAGAMAAIFKAPITAVVFAVEVIMIDLTVTSIVPLILASLSAALTSILFLGVDVLYKFEVTDKFIFSDIPYFIGLGILAGFLAVYFTRTYMFVNNSFKKINNIWFRLGIGGIILGVLIFLFPSLYGEGYEAINSALSGDFEHLYNHSIFFEYKDSFYIILILFAVTLLFKVIATAATFGAGGVGGIFAPSLFLGSNLGLGYAMFVNHFGLGKLSLSNFAFVGMAGLIAGNLHAPLTAIFLIAEITGGYELFMPLMIVSIVSFLTVKLFQPNSVYTIQLASRGELMTHHQDKNILKMMSIDKLVEKNLIPVKMENSLGDLVKVISVSSRNIFPVVDDDDQFLGIVLLDDIRNIMFKPELYENTFVHDFMHTTTIKVDVEDNMHDVADKFHKTGMYNLPVLKDGKYIGFVSRANVFSTYRRKLKYFSSD